MPQQITESSALTELAEASEIKTGRLLVQAISAGHGSSGYYSPAVLEQAARDRLITRGTPLHLDHATESEARDRPERSVQTIAGVFTGDAAYDPTRKALIGEVQIFSPHRERLSEMAPYIGLSIWGSATDVVEGEVDGRKVRVIEGLAAIDSVDFVVRAGRGGQVLDVGESDALFDHITATYGQALRESGYSLTTTETTPAPSAPAAPAVGQPTESSKEMNMAEIADAELTQLRESAGQVTSLTEARDAAAAERDRAKQETALLRAATERALDGLAESALSLKVIKRVVRETTAELPVKDGALDTEAFDQRVKESREDFESLITESAGGKVVGFGASAPAGQVSESRPTVNPWGRPLSAVKEA